MVTKPRKPRIIQETVKDLHTSHWDLDMLSLSELETLLCTGRGNHTATDGSVQEEAAEEQTTSASVPASGAASESTSAATDTRKPD